MAVRRSHYRFLPARLIDQETGLPLQYTGPIPEPSLPSTDDSNSSGTRTPPLDLSDEAELSDSTNSNSSSFSSTTDYAPRQLLPGPLERNPPYRIVGCLVYALFVLWWLRESTSDATADGAMIASLLFWWMQATSVVRVMVLIPFSILFWGKVGSPPPRIQHLSIRDTSLDYLDWDYWGERDQSQLY